MISGTIKVGKKNFLPTFNYNLKIPIYNIYDYKIIAPRNVPAKFTFKGAVHDHKN